MFTLKDYLEEMRSIASRNSCTDTSAVDKFVENLNIMKEYHKGTGKLNYHVLGQHWCDLSYRDKIAQKNEAKALISATPRRRRY